MSKGGMQTMGLNDSPLCRCGKTTSRKVFLQNGVEICIHFTRKSTYWHIFDGEKVRRTFKKPRGIQ